MGRRVNIMLLLAAMVSALLLGACTEALAPGGEIDLTEQGTVESPSTEPTVTEAATEEATEEMTEEATQEATEEATVEGAAQPLTRDMTLAEALQNEDEIVAFGTALLAAIDANLLGDLDLSGVEFTVFVPDSDVWSQISSSDITSLTSDAAAAQAFFLCYVAEGSISQDDMASAGTVNTVGGEVITVTGSAGDLTLNDGARIVQEINTTNGNIYVVDDLVCAPGE